MHIALTGASGFIGSVLARDAHAAGHTVTALVRSTSRRNHIEPYVDRFVEGDQDDESAWPALLEGADAVIHNSVDWRALRDGDIATHERSNVLGSIRFLRVSAPRPFVFMSSIAVHHDMSPRWDGKPDEDHPLRPSTLYGALKAAVEAHLWAAHYGDGRHVAAIRPCAVYGIDPTIERTIGWPFIESIRAGEPFARPGGGKFVHVDDVAKATLAAFEPVADGRAFNLADCYARWCDWAKLVADRLGVQVEIDDSSPATPKNVFSKDAARDLGVTLDRGMDGIAAHIDEMLAVSTAAP